MARHNCPVCGCKKKSRAWKMNYVIPDGWTLPTQNVVRFCKNCGMIWYDNDATQQDYNIYYQDKAGFGLDNEDTRKRLDETARIVVNIGLPKDAVIVDFGGGSGYLCQKLYEAGYGNCRVWDIGDPAPEPESVDLICAIHALEHVLSPQNVVAKFNSSLKDGAAVIVEIPNATRISAETTPPLLDYHVEHVNHFSPFTLDLLMANEALLNVGRGQYFYEPLNAWCYRATYVKSWGADYLKSMQKVRQNMWAKAEKLRAIDYPVIVWGCGSTTWMMLADVPGLKVAYFVDVNKLAYPTGSTIKGIPVKHAPDSGEPIVVMAQGQRQAILDNIKALGLTNEVIEI